MAGLVKGIITGQNLALESATAVADVGQAGATYAILEANATNDTLNALLAELRANGLIKV